MKKRLTSSIFLIGLSALATGCASLGRDSSRDAVLVQSSPSGAKIYVNAAPVGTTPQYVLVERERRPAIDLKSGNRYTKVPLETKYRWSKSFWSNLIWLTYAPIGWGVDLLTGSAWDIEDPQPVRLGPSSKSQASAPTPPRTRIIAIAPPLAGSIALSDAGGLALEKQLGEEIGFSKSSLIRLEPYRSTLETFVAHHVDYDGAPPPSENAMLFYRLGVSAIYESQVERKGDLLVLKSRLRDVVTNETSETRELVFDSQGKLEYAFTGQGLFQLLPNTVGVDFTSENLSYTGSENDVIGLEPVSGATIFEEGLKYLSAINITNQPARRYGRASRWQFGFSPALRASRRRVISKGANNFPEQEFTRWWLSAGYGPEVGFQFSRHYIYFNLIPSLFWSEIKWDREGRRSNVSHFNVTAQSELGYLLFIDTNWSLKAFVRYLTEDNAGWSEALSSISPNRANFGTAGLNLAGISIGYRFEPKFESWRASKLSREGRK